MTFMRSRTSCGGPLGAFRNLTVRLLVGDCIFSFSLLDEDLRDDHGNIKAKPISEHLRFRSSNVDVDSFSVVTMFLDGLLDYHFLPLRQGRIIVRVAIEDGFNFWCPLLATLLFQRGFLDVVATGRSFGSLN